MQTLPNWVQARGGWISDKVAIREAATGGRGLFAVSEVSPGETLVSLPAAAILFAEDAIRSIRCPELEAFFESGASGMPRDEAARAQGVFSLMAHLLEDLGNLASPFAPYLQDLDRHWTQDARSRFPMFWPQEAKRMLEGTLALELFTLGERGVEREFQLLQAKCPRIAAGHTLEGYKRVWALVNSHVLNYPGDPLAAGTSRKAQSGLMPYFDLVNHFLPPPANVLRSEDDIQGHQGRTLGRYGVRAVSNASDAPRHLQLWVDRPMLAGDEVTDVYGIKANDDLLWSWGFTVPWIRNGTCLSRTEIAIDTDGLSRAVPHAGAKRRRLHGLGPQRFRIDSCRGGSLDEALALARFWHADVGELALRASCGFDAPDAEGRGGGTWRLSRPCAHVSRDGEQAALNVLLGAVRAKLGGLRSGGSDEDNRLLAEGLRHDATVVREDERQVLRNVEVWLRDQAAALRGPRRQSRRQRGKKRGEL